MRPALILVVALTAASYLQGGQDGRRDPHFRRPVAAVSLDDGRLIAVAHRDNGSVSLIETAGWTVVSERRVGKQLADLVAFADGRVLLAVDSQSSELIVLERGDDGVTVRSRHTVAQTPVSVLVSQDGNTVSVTSLWGRQLTLFRIEDAAESELVRVRDVPLPFAPRLQCVLDERRIVVADSFGGQLAVVTVDDGQIAAIQQIPGHNIRGMALSPNGRELFITHQFLEQYAPTTYDSIHWGNLMENLIRVLPVDALIDPELDAASLGRAMPFGTTGDGAADPAGLAFIADDRLICVSSGTDRAQTFPTLHPIISPTIPTGRRPTAVTVIPQLGCTVVVNTLGDSLTVIDNSTGKAVRDVALGPTPEPGPQQRGESLFFDAHRSHDGWLSCHSCHTDGHSNGQLADTHGDGTFGTPKRILSLLGTRDNNPWAWNGSLRTLHEQTAQSIRSSMVGDVEPEQVNDLVAYLHTLAAPPPLRPVPTSTEDEQLVIRGREVFNTNGCAKCHVPPLTFTSDLIVEVGLSDEEGATKFNPPSLRGVSQQGRLFHDGRAENLRAVFAEFGHQAPGGLGEPDLDALVRYLEGL